MLIISTECVGEVDKRRRNVAGPMDTEREIVVMIKCIVFIKIDVLVRVTKRIMLGFFLVKIKKFRFKIYVLFYLAFFLFCSTKCCNDNITSFFSQTRTISKQNVQRHGKN